MTEVKVSIDRAPAGTSTRRDASKDCQPLAIAKPLFMCMTLVGIQTGGQEKSGHKFTWFSICGVIWCTFTALLVWLNVARLIPTHLDEDFAHGFDEKTFIRIVVFVWYLQCAINVAVCLRASIKNNLLHRMYTLWTKYCRKRSFQRHAKSLRRVVWLLTVIFVLFCIINLVIMAFILYQESDVTEEFATVLYTPVGKSEGMKLFLVFYQSFIAGTWILPLWLFLVICFVNTQLLEDARTSIIDETDKKTKKFLGRIEQIRMLHEEACVMVVCADDTFNVFVALGLATDIPMGCFEMYMLIWPTTDSKFIQLFNVFLLGMFVFHLAIIMWSSSRVHTEAHASFTQLQKIRTVDMDESNKFELLVFLARLRGEPIGISAWNTFVIDRPSILTIFSIILTYFVILIELRMPTTSTPVISNETVIETTTMAPITWS